MTGPAARPVAILCAVTVALSAAPAALAARGPQATTPALTATPSLSLETARPLPVPPRPNLRTPGRIAPPPRLVVPTVMEPPPPPDIAPVASAPPPPLPTATPAVPDTLVNPPRLGPVLPPEIAASPAPEPAPAQSAALPPEPEAIATPEPEPRVTDPAPPAIAPVTDVPEPEPEQQTASLPPVQPSAAPAAVSLDGPLTVVFEDGSDTPPAAADALLDAVAERMRADESLRLQLRSYAAGTADTAREARQTSLARALALRERLTAFGVRSTRIDIRALGTGPADAATDSTAGRPADRPADRIDLDFTN